MLGGETESIRIEEPSVDKAEFVVSAGTRRELHQVKRSHPNGKWSLAALRADGLLQAIGRQLAGNDDRFVFASGSDARELAELCEAARDAESDAEFERHFLKAAVRKKRFEELRAIWRCDVPTARERLWRIDIRTIDERELENKVRWGVEALLLADPARPSRSFGGSPRTPRTAQSPARTLSRNSPGAGFRYDAYATRGMPPSLCKKRQIAT